MRAGAVAVGEWGDHEVALGHAAHVGVRFHDKGIKHFHHPVVGDLTLTFETLKLTADTGLTMAVYTAEPGAKSEVALNLLASWTATPDPAQAANALDRS